MAESYDLVARLVLQGPQNLDQIIRRIHTSVNSIKSTVNITIPPAANQAIQALNASLTTANTLLAQMSSSAQSASTALKSASTPLKTTAQNTAHLAQSSTKASKEVKKVADNMKMASTEVAEFGRASALAVRRFAAFSIPAGILLSLIMNIKKGVGAAVDFEREMIKVQQVTGRTREGLSELEGTIGRLSTTWGSSSSELLNVSRILSQAGLNARKTKVAMEAIAKSDLSPTFNNMTETAEGSIAAMQQFGFEAEALEGKLGSLNAVAGAFAVESTDLISAIRRTGGAFEAAGGSIEQLMALFTSVRSTTRESADSIATGFRTIFTRLQRPRTIEFLKELGVELQTLDGKFVGPYEAVNQLHNALRNLDPKDVRFAQVVEELGGFRQVSKVIPLIQQFDKSQLALAVAIGGTTSVMEDAELTQQSLAVQIAKVAEQYQILYRSVAGSEIFKGVSKFALDFAKNLSQVVQQIKPMIPLLLMVGTLKVGGIARQFVGGFGQGMFKLGGHEEQSGIIKGNISATQVLSKSVAVNTSAVEKNTAALYSRFNPMGVMPVSPIGRDTRKMTYTQKRFPGMARGGLVPGSGSGDTFPAMLQPGEFVLKKSAVQAMGYENIAGINKYATGGKTSKSGTHTAVLKHGILGAVALEGSGKRYATVSQNVPQGLKIPGHGQPFTRVEGRLRAATLDKKISGEFQSEFLPSIDKFLNGLVSSVFTRSNIPALNMQEQQIAKAASSRIDTRAMLGHVFEALTSKMTGAQITPPGATFDIDSVSPDIIRRFNLSFSPKLRTERYLELKKQIAGQEGDIGSKIVKAIGSGMLSGKDFTARKHEKDFYKETPARRRRIIAQNKRSGMNIPLPGLASGGQVDTVPALLTPGEFVVNKQSAQSIGYGNLHKMNKYAAGGQVGGNIGVNAGQNLFGLIMLSSFVQTLVDADSELGKLTSSFGQALIAMEALRMGMGGAQRIGGGLAQSFGAKGQHGPAYTHTMGMIYNQPVLPTQSGVSDLDRQLGVKPVPQRINRFMGNDSHLNKLTNHLFGMDKEVVGLTGALGAAGLAAIYFGGQMTATADKMAASARSIGEVQAAVSKAQSAATLSAAGTGALGAGMMGMQVGAQFGGRGGLWGLLAGTLIGGGLGVGYAALNADKEAERVRKINRTERGTEADELVNNALEDLLSNNVNIATTPRWADLTKGVGEKLSIARESTDKEEVITNRKAVRALLPQMEQLRTKLIDSGTSLDDFKNKNTNAGVIIETMAFAQQSSVYDVIKATEKEIATRKKSADLSKLGKNAASEFGHLTDVLQNFGSTLANMTYEFNKASEEIHTSIELLHGNVSITPFGGGKGFSGITDILSGGIVNMQDQEAGIKQAFGKGNISAQLIDLSNAINDMPEILRDVARGGTDVNQERIINRFQEETKKYKPNTMGKYLSDIVGSAIEETILKRSGEDTGDAGFISGVLSNSRAMTEKLIGPEVKAMNDEIQGILKSMLENASVLDKIITSQIQLQREIVQANLQLKKDALSNRQQLYELRNPEKIFGLKELQAAKSSQITDLVPNANALGITGMAKALDSVNQQIQSQQNLRQGMQYGTDPYIQATEGLKGLYLRAYQLQTALGLLRDTTEEAAQIQKTLSKLEENKKARYGIAERYAFAGRAERQEILRSIDDVMKIQSGLDPAMLPADRRGAAYNMYQQMRNTPALMFGVDAKGQGKTGGEAAFGVVDKMLQRIFGAEFGGEIAKNNNPLERNAKETEQINALETLANRRMAVETAMVTNMESMNVALQTKVNDLIKLNIGGIEQGIEGILKRAELSNLKRREGEAQLQYGDLQTRQNKLREANKLVGGVMPGRGAEQILGTLDAEKETYDKYKRFGEGTAYFQARKGNIQGRQSIQDILMGSGGDRNIIQSRLIESGMMGERGKYFENQEEAQRKTTDNLTDIYHKWFKTIPLNGQEYIDATGSKERFNFNKDLDNIFSDLAGFSFESQLNALDNLGKAAKIPSDKLDKFGQLLSQHGDKLYEIIGNLGKVNSQELKDLPTSITTLKGSIDDLNIKIQALGEKPANANIPQGNVVNGNVIAKAMGGVINGTDTVPAMLTPGEFVVKKSIAQKNMSMLTALNQGQSVVGNEGVLYARQGGKMSREEYQAEIKRRQDEYKMGKKERAVGKDVDKDSWAYNRRQEIAASRQRNRLRLQGRNTMAQDATNIIRGGRKYAGGLANIGIAGVERLQKGMSTVGRYGSYMKDYATMDDGVRSLLGGPAKYIQNRNQAYKYSQQQLQQNKQISDVGMMVGQAIGGGLQDVGKAGISSYNYMTGQDKGIYIGGQRVTPFNRQALMDEERKRLRSYRNDVGSFHNGGFVPGTGEQRAVLQGGEYVLSKSAVQALAKGGVVKKYADGGSVTGNGQEVQMGLSGDVKSIIDSMSQGIRDSAGLIQESFNSAPDKFTTIFDSFSGQFINTVQIMDAAVIKLQTSVTALSDMPKEFDNIFTNNISSLTSFGQTFDTSVSTLDNSFNVFGQGVNRLAEAMTQAASFAESIRGAAQEMKDALAQDINISVTHKHEPITVRLEQGGTTTQDGNAFKDMVLSVVGPEIDKLRDRIRERGFGLA
jgi:TP901 family phage tail tape measure protein